MNTKQKNTEILTELEKYCIKHDSRYFQKGSHYFKVYDRYFQHYKNKNIVILEIGIRYGGSLQLWKNYFGEKAHIYGIDINPECKNLEEPDISILIGSQSDRKFLKEVKNTIPRIDILIDDGGHSMVQQITTFEELFDHVKNDGMYICEDICTSYMLDYGGGYQRKGTFIEYSKNFIDFIHANYSEQNALQENHLTNNISAIHYYFNLLIIEKCEKSKYHHVSYGSKPLSTHITKENISKLRLKLYHIKRYFIKKINLFLRVLKIKAIFND